MMTSLRLPRAELELRAQARIELERREKLRQGLADLYFFNNQVLGYEQMAEVPHRLMCDSVQHGSKRQLHLWPRGHFKSTMITVGYALWRIVQNPNIRILVTNATLSNAKSFLREIKGHIEHNDEFIRLFGALASKDEKWTETEIIVSSRTKNLKEPTIQVAGVGQALASQHYDLIINDDLIDQDSVNTKELIQKTITWHALSLSLLEPDGDEINIGTRYHFADIYGHMIASGHYQTQIHAAIEDGKPIFPSRFTLEKLAELRQSQGSYVYSCQYLNNPIDDESAKFKRADFRYFQEKDLEGKQVYTTMTIDRAYSLNKTADFTGITIRKVDRDNIWYIPYAVRHKATEGELIKRIFDLREHFKVDKVGIEQKAFNDTIKPVLDEEMRRRNEFFTVVELKGTSSKISRIEGLVPRFESHSVFFLEGLVDLEDELLRFPSAEHDDLADALAYHNDMEGTPADTKKVQAVWDNFYYDGV